jgi:hypothetical protein
MGTKSPGEANSSSLSPCTQKSTKLICISNQKNPVHIPTARSSSHLYLAHDVAVHLILPDEESYNHCTFSYETNLWGTAFTSNTEILERFQSKVLHMIAGAPWYVPNTVIWRDLQTPTVKEQIRHYSSQYSERLSVHPNDLVVNLMLQPDNSKCEDTCQTNCLADFKFVFFVVQSLRFSL